MSRDRLAAFQVSTGVNQNPPMTNGTDQPHRLEAGEGGLDFNNEFSVIQDQRSSLSGMIQQLSSALSSPDRDPSATNHIQRLQEASSHSVSDIKSRLTLLESSIARLPAGDDKKARLQQAAALKNRFKAVIEEYQKEEKKNRDKLRERMERQYRIVKPEATDEEVRSAIEDGRGDQIFSQALLNSNRYADAKGAYQDVQERRDEIKRIEQKMIELAQLVNELSVMVEQDDEKIENIDEKVDNTSKDMGIALQNVQEAVKSARNTRKLKRYALGCFVLILVILAIVLGVVFGHHGHHGD
ncbi:t-SNARE [Atractiella rhizophila]|nr:t-SNARE [Atractiella rhizophila]